MAIYVAREGVYAHRIIRQNDYYTCIVTTLETRIVFSKKMFMVKTITAGGANPFNIVIYRTYDTMRIMREILYTVGFFQTAYS